MSEKSILGREINEQPESIRRLIEAETRNSLRIAQLVHGKYLYGFIAARGKQGELFIGCGVGMIEAREVQAEGRRRVSGREFANGYHIKGGEAFGNG